MRISRIGLIVKSSSGFLEILLLMNYVLNPTVIILCINIGLLYYRTHTTVVLGPVIQQPNVNA